MRTLNMTALTRGLSERDMTNRKPTPRGTNTAKPPRTREGQAYPGGRALRRAMKRLSLRQSVFVAKPDRTAPGSMKG